VDKSTAAESKSSTAAGQLQVTRHASNENNPHQTAAASGTPTAADGITTGFMQPRQTA
jgi:hypothetical protein